MMNRLRRETNAPKKALQRLTNTIRVNATGTHSIPPQMIIKTSGRKDGKPSKAQSITNIDLKKLPVRKERGRGCGTIPLECQCLADIRTFSSFLQAFKWQVLLKKGRKNVILLIDGFAGHKLQSDDCQRIDIGEGIKAFCWEFILVIWLPTNTTSHIQSLDAGLIKSWKVRGFSMSFCV
jgi:hypothetical protein